jgi:phosphopantetheine adenylyltransferase
LKTVKINRIIFVNKKERKRRKEKEKINNKSNKINALTTFMENLKRNNYYISSYIDPVDDRHSDTIEMNAEVSSASVKREVL